MGASWSVKPGQQLGVFALVMINVIAVNNLSGLSFIASLGSALWWLYGALVLGFLVPVALLAAELASAWPERGGLYAWVKRAFGVRWGFFMIWIQWVYNMFWYPTIMIFLVSTFTTEWFPQWANHPSMLLPMIWALFGCATLANAFGMRLSSTISTLGTLLGTFVPMGFLMLMGGLWLYHHGLPALPHGTAAWSQWHTHITMILAVMFGMVGIEMSGVHAQEVRQPQRTYPLAMLISVLLIAMTQIGSSSSIAWLVSADELSVVTGIVQAFKAFFRHSPSLLEPIMIALILLGGLCGVSAWVIGPIKGMMQAVQDGCGPAYLAHTNNHGAPVGLLLVQALVFFVLSGLYAWLPTVQSAYEVLTMITTQMSLLVYVVMMAAVWRLRQQWQWARVVPHFQIPGGMLGLGIVSFLVLLTALGGFVLGFMPSVSMEALHGHYALYLMGLMAVVLSLPWWLTRHLTPTGRVHASLERGG